MTSSDPGAAGLGATVVTSVARYKDVDALSLPPLTHVIDPDSLDQLFRTSDGHTNLAASLSFTYAGVTVSITDGDPPTVNVRELGLTETEASAAGGWRVDSATDTGRDDAGDR